MGPGSGVRVEQRTKVEEEVRRVILSRAYPTGIDPEPNINVAGMFPPE